MPGFREYFDAVAIATSFLVILPAILIGAYLIPGHTVVGAFILAVGLIVTGVILAFCAAGLRMEAREVIVAFAFGAPRLSIDYEDIENVSVREVRAIREYGGWGLRLRGNGETGVILRSGPALVLHRRSAGAVVITLRDAERAAREIRGRRGP